MAKRVGVDKWIFFTTLLLVVAGLVMVFSASAVMAQERYNSPYGFVIRQALLGRGRRLHHDRPDRTWTLSVTTRRASSIPCSPSPRCFWSWSSSLSRLAPYPSLDPLWQLLHLPAL